MTKAIITLILLMQATKPLTLAWDAITDNRVTKVIIFDISVTPEVQVAEVACTAVPFSCPTQVTFTMPRADHQYVARTANADWYSDNSNTVTVNGPPNPPNNVVKK